MPRPKPKLRTSTRVRARARARAREREREREIERVWERERNKTGICLSGRAGGVYGVEEGGGNNGGRLGFYRSFQLC